MKTIKKINALTVGLLAAATLGSYAHGAVLVDDFWTDGSRLEQNLPTESAWYASTASSLSASAGSLLGTATTSSRMWITYFTAATSPATLGINERLTATLVFKPSNVATAPATTRGLRIGLFNFGAPSAVRQTADSFSTSGIGANVPGYMLNMNFAQTVTIDNPIQLLERTDVPNVNLMGSTAQYTALGSGGGAAGGAAFVAGTEYTLALSVLRTGADSVDVSATISGVGLDLSHTVSDASSASFTFDGLAIRVNKSTDAAEFFDLSNFQVAVVPEPASMAVVGLGLLGLAAWRGRRSN